MANGQFTEEEKREILAAYGGEDKMQAKKDSLSMAIMEQRLAKLKEPASESTPETADERLKRIVKRIPDEGGVMPREATSLDSAQAYAKWKDPSIRPGSIVATEEAEKKAGLEAGMDDAMKELIDAQQSLAESLPEDSKERVVVGANYKKALKKYIERKSSETGIESVVAPEDQAAMDWYLNTKEPSRLSKDRKDYIAVKEKLKARYPNLIVD